MPNPFGKARKSDSPYAIFKDFGPAKFEWRVLKTYKMPANEDEFSRWFFDTRSVYTYGKPELGDGYVRDVKAQGFLVAATPEFIQAYPRLNVLSVNGKALPTPEDYLKEQANG